jgi:predicted small secreted protein
MRAADAGRNEVGGPDMKTSRILRLALPALAAVALAGCVTAPGYGYRAGQGDYYYGQPSVEYRYRGGYGPYHHGYGYPYGYGRSGWSFGIHYGHPYYRYGYGYGGRYAYPWYGWPWYGYPYHHRPPVVVRPRPDGDGNREAPPWRDLDRLRELERNRRGVMHIEREPLRADAGRSAPPPQPTMRSPARSRMGENIGRARHTQGIGQEQED